MTIRYYHDNLVGLFYVLYALQIYAIFVSSIYLICTGIVSQGRWGQCLHVQDCVNRCCFVTADISFSKYAPPNLHCARTKTALGQKDAHNNDRVSFSVDWF